MWEIIKRDWWSMWPFILFSFGFIFIIYLLQWEPPNGFLLAYLLFFLLANLFYIDHKSKVNRFILSLPVKRNEVVFARYLFIIGFGHLFILFIWVINLILPIELPLHWMEFIIMVTMMNFIIAVSIPIYYAVDGNVWVALIIQLAVLLISSFIFVYIAADPHHIFGSVKETWLYIIDLQPIVFVVIISLIVLTISLSISRIIFAKKDLQ